MRWPVLVLGLLQLAGSAMVFLFFLAGNRGTFLQFRGFPQLPAILAAGAAWSGFTMVNFSWAIQNLLQNKEREQLGRVLKVQKFVWLSLAVWGLTGVVGNLIALFVSQYF